jgi:hypothetical protein
MLLLLAVVTILPLYQSATVVDRIAVVVGKHAIKTSDIERDLRVTQFLNNEGPDATSIPPRKASAQRLIDQELIREDIAAAVNTSASVEDAEMLYRQILRARFGGSEPLLLAELKRRGLTKQQLIEQLQWQLTVLRFIDERFRPGVVISDEDINEYWEQHSAELRRKDLKLTSLEAATPEIRETLEGEQINRDFEAWLAQARKNTRIEVKIEDLK